MCSTAKIDVTFNQQGTSSMQVKRVLSLFVPILVLSLGVTSFASAAEKCNASWYGPGFHGKKMANGHRFNQNDVSVVAHKTLPMGTRIRITNLKNGNAITAVVQDRGPFHRGRCVDVSKAGGEALGLIGSGTAPVSVVIL